MPRRHPPLHLQVLPRLSKIRSKGNLTIQKIKGDVVRLCKLIHQLYGLEQLAHLSRKHVLGAFEVLRARNLSKSTLASYATAARYIANFIGKPDIVPSNQELGIVRRIEDRYRPIKPDQEKLRLIREQLYEHAEWLGLAHDMREAFGLRSKESLLSVNSISLNNIELLVVRGAKGGRPRTIPIVTQRQRIAYNAVRQFLQRNPGWTSLIRSAMDLKQALHFQKNVLYALGATKENRANAHALRHGFAQEMINHLTPQELVDILGHGRMAVLKHYIQKKYGLVDECSRKTTQQLTATA